MITVFTSLLFREQTTNDERKALVANFKTYKNGNLPSNIGRDVAYHRPLQVENAGLKHIHIGQWSMEVLQWTRTSDISLAYCESTAKNNTYALIALLRPNAHDQQRDYDLMIKLAAEALHFNSTH